MYEIPLNLSHKFHLKLALFISIWGVIFLVIISLFDVANLSFTERLLLMSIYGLILFLSYILIIPVQSWLYKKVEKWTVLTELCILLIFGAFVLIASFLYYQSRIISGGHDFKEYLLGIYLPIFFIIVIVLVFFRRYGYSPKKRTDANSPKELILLNGTNKYDFIEVSPADIVCVFSAGNYVEVFYLSNGSLCKKLIRSTLKNIQVRVPHLKKVHRSRLINPDHLQGWKDNSTLILTQMEVGVSRNFKNNIQRIYHSSQKEGTRH